MFKLSNTLETGISDHHKLVSTIWNKEASKEHLRLKLIGHTKYLSLKTLIEFLKDKLENRTAHLYAEFEKVFLKELNMPLWRRRF